ncbi:MAG: host attachment family protein [Sphingomonadaceae bacterium]|uniref:host attachment protein n=1 Tax=Thermaurantiacus sp. TaxID=2820283 RepID=UPI00298F04C0|nr:host attachment protein [Thermaurantiacus sp.]MCS6987527.1 host attachment family protein [Sphingomonadaceae bacterium]MDW8415128.1 host attachment protein [Thermaurantiacus sp.]
MKIPHDALVVVADGGRLALFRNRGAPFAPQLELVEQEAIEFPRTSELAADRPGRAFESSGTRRSAYEETDLHDRAEEAFCRGVAERIVRLLPEAKAGVLLVAAPRALGVIRAALPAEARATLLGEVAKDYAGRNAAELGELLAKLAD